MFQNSCYHLLDSAAMQSRTYHPRHGYSLLEVIIATSILAGSAFAIHTLIAQGTRASLIAQRETEALEIANTLLDEAITFGNLDERDRETTVESRPEWSYRLSVRESEPALVVEIFIEVFETKSARDRSVESGSSNQPVCQLRRWVRKDRMQPPIDDANEGPRRPNLQRRAGGQ